MAGIGAIAAGSAPPGGVVTSALRFGHGAVIAAGPWIFTVLSIAAIHMATARILAEETSYAFRGLVIYAFALSLLASAPIVNVAIRQLADDIYLERTDHARARYLAALVLSALSSALLAFIVFVLVFAMSGRDVLVAMSATLIVGLIWPSLAYCGALHDYSGVSRGFIAGLLVAVSGAVGCAYAGWGAAPMMAAFACGLAITFFILASRILGVFVQPVIGLKGHLAELASGIGHYWLLATGSLLAIVAIWIDKWIIWLGPYGVGLDNGLVSAPLYDGAMFVAYLMIIPALGMFVTAIETRFLVAYRGYYQAIRHHASLARIRANGERLAGAFGELLWPIVQLQAVLCVVLIMAAPAVASWLGVQHQQIGILRLGLLAALFQFVFLACSSLLLFFDLHRRYLALQLLFLGSQCVLTLVTMKLGYAYYGLGHLAACALSALVALCVLDDVFGKLDYLTFAAALRSGRDSARKPRGEKERQEAGERAEPQVPDIYIGGAAEPLLRP